METIFMQLNKIRFMERVALIVTLSLLLCTLSAQFAGGDGTVDNPYRIETAAHLHNLRLYLGEAHNLKHFIQAADINLNVSPYNLAEGWAGIGVNEINSFRGTFNGNGYTISNLYINRPGYNGNNQGLFGYTYNAVIINVSLENVNIRGNQSVGALIGYCERSAVQNCFSTGRVNGGNRVGGLLGTNSRSTVTKCYSTAAIEGVDATGGLAGYSFSNTYISYSFTTGRVVGRHSVGGLVGDNYAANICCSYSKSRVEGNINVGGLAGRSISRSYIYTSYSYGYVSGTNRVGGLVGSEDESENEGSYWNTQTSGQNTSAAGSGRTTAEMTYRYDINTYVDWDFDEIWMEDRLSQINDGYPFFRWYSSIISPNPLPAVLPNPANNLTNVPVYLDSLRWTYYVDPVFPDPKGFKVFLNRTGNFGGMGGYFWVPFREGNYQYARSIESILPMDYSGTYYWKVVPTTELESRGEYYSPARKRSERDGRRIFAPTRGDAENCPVWHFTTIDPNPQPNIAENPNPVDRTVEIPLSLPVLEWSFEFQSGYSEPLGFRVYLNETGEFAEDESFGWVIYNSSQSLYELAMPIDLQLNNTYYWQVIPTTDEPESRGEYYSPARGDAENCPVWSFTTTIHTTIDDKDDISLYTHLTGNYPNPFNPATTITFYLSEESLVQLKVFNVQGQLVNELAAGFYPAGRTDIVWKGQDANSTEMPSGVYFYRLTTGESVYLKKMLLLR